MGIVKVVVIVIGRVIVVEIVNVVVIVIGRVIILWG